MTEHDKPLPVRRPELVRWSLGGDRLHLVRNRNTGETFRLGEEEHLLLSQLESGQTAQQLCAVFAARFGQALSREELAEFLKLAEQRGLLQPYGEAPQVSFAGDGSAGGHADGNVGNTSVRITCVTRVLGKSPRDVPRRVCQLGLNTMTVALQWLAGFFQCASQQLQFIRLKHLDYVPRSDDVFIVTYPRSGTTWMQMIMYQLTTDGRMDIPHIAEYCPWFEKSQRAAHGFATRPPPRVFKSHLPWRAIPKGPCKYIYIARDGKDVAVSYYHLYRKYNGYEGTFAEFFERFMHGKVLYGSWFRHVQGWWAHRHDPNVLHLTYEELTEDLAGCIGRIADFCGFIVPPEKLPGIVERCGFAFMKKHEAQFDPALETLWEQGVQLNSFLRSGRVGGGAIQLDSEQAARFDAASRQHLDGTPFACRAAQASAT